MATVARSLRSEATWASLCPWPRAFARPALRLVRGGPARVSDALPGRGGQRAAALLRAACRPWLRGRSRASSDRAQDRGSCATEGGKTASKVSAVADTAPHINPRAWGRDQKAYFLQDRRAQGGLHCRPQESGRVVTEYVRTEVRIQRTKVDGIHYNSSRRNAKTALVLFADQGNLILEKPEWPHFYRVDGRWLRLIKSSVTKVTDRGIRRWTATPRLQLFEDT
jgi:hypothetical protein